MFANSVFVTGTNRGLGLGFVKQLAERTNYLFAGCRSPKDAEELQSIAAKHKNVTVLELDVTNGLHINKAVKTISDIVGSDGLNCLINNAGIVDSFTKLDAVSAETLSKQYQVNAIAPVMLTQACLPLLHQASSLVSCDQMSVSRAAVINVSTILASIQLNSTGKVYGYRMAKIAMNMFSKNLSIELKDSGILVSAIHPGWVKTGLGGPKAPLTVDEAIKDILNVLTVLRKEDSGKFYGWDENEIPW